MVYVCCFKLESCQFPGSLSVCQVERLMAATSLWLSLDFDSERQRFTIRSMESVIIGLLFENSWSPDNCLKADQEKTRILSPPRSISIPAKRFQHQSTQTTSPNCPELSDKQCHDNAFSWAFALGNKPNLFFRVYEVGGCYNCTLNGHNFSECPYPNGSVCHGCGMQGLKSDLCPFCRPEDFNLKPPESYSNRLKEKRRRNRRNH